MSINKFYSITGLVLLCISSCIFIVACTSITDTKAPIIFPDKFPRDVYLQAINSNDKAVFEINAQETQVVIYVYRAGKLAKLGHDHVVANHHLQGYVLHDKKSGNDQADLFLAVNELVVDEVELRKAAHFDTQPSASDIQGTREHMLESVLEEKKFPFVQIHVEQWNPQQFVNEAQVTFILHGVSRIAAVPVLLETDSNNVQQLKGRVSLKQSDFGIKPYSALGGLLQVKDQVDIEFTITARPIIN